ncbi:chorismate mutase [Micromonospora sp. NBC_01740]|uniref:chorismate mutase n=1 Tax=Micromonospora sp. NBC_01740 TaxID=2975986 RepID=UPI002E14A23D|nr:chorismate mutase [Micromonospora sp. NBC_01740]
MDELDRLRHELDVVDLRILEAIKSRFDVIRRIARHKQASGVPMMQSDRVSFVRSRYAAYGLAHGIPDDLLDRIAAELIETACRLEDELMANDPAGTQQ